MRIKEIMKEKGVTQKELAQRLGVNQSTISVAVNGNATIETIRRIADALGVREYELFDLSPEDVEFMHQLGRDQYLANSQVFVVRCPHCLKKMRIKITPL